MLNPSELTVTLNPAHRMLRSTLFTIAIVLGALQINEAYAMHDRPRLLLGIVLVGACLFGLLYIWRFRLTLTEGYLESQSIFGTKRVLWTDVVQVRERKRHLNVYGSTDSVRVPVDINHGREVAAKVASKLNALPVLRLHNVSSYWGLADRDDEGRLIRR